MKDFKNIFIVILLIIIVSLSVFIVLDKNNKKEDPKEKTTVEEKNTTEKVISCTVDPSSLGIAVGITDPNITDFKYELIYYFKDNALVKRNERVTETYATTESLLDVKNVRLEYEKTSIYKEAQELNKKINKTEEIIYDEVNKKIIHNTYLTPSGETEWKNVRTSYENYNTALENLTKIYDCK